MVCTTLLVVQDVKFLFFFPICLGPSCFTHFFFKTKTSVFCIFYSQPNMQNTVTDVNNRNWCNSLSGMNDQISQSFLCLLTFFVHNTKSKLFSLFQIISFEVKVPATWLSLDAFKGWRATTSIHGLINYLAIRAGRIKWQLQLIWTV